MSSLQSWLSPPMAVGWYPRKNVVLKVESKVMPQAAETLHTATMVHQTRQHAGPILEAATLHFGKGEIGACLPALLGLPSSSNGRCGHVDGHTECWAFGCNVVDRQCNPGDSPAQHAHEKLPHV